jgi:hypothetical protein
MKALEIKDYDIFSGGLVGLVAQSLARPPRADVSGPGCKTQGASASPEEKRPGMLAQLGRWFWRQKRRGIEADLVRSRDMFEALDRWLWKQQVRETEAWLAQSKDVFELEARIRRLERGPARL